MIRVAIAEDDRLYRASLEMLFSVTDGYELVDSFADAATLYERAGELARTGADCPWDVIIMDMQMPRMSGIEGTRGVKAAFPEVRVLVLTVFEEPPAILQAICAGADGYLLKRSAVTSILAHVDAVMAGGAPLTPGVAATVLEVVRRSPTSRPEDTLDLTPREREVLQALVDGLSYKQVAAELGIGIETVRSHIRRLYRKLRVHSVAEAVSKALRHGLVA